MDRSFQCFSCNTGFSSLELLASHPPCSSSSFDLAKVKTEVEDTEQDVQRSKSASSHGGPPVKATDSAAVYTGHVKTEVKSEIPELPETGDTAGTAASAVIKESAFLNLRNQQIVCQYRGRGARARGSRGGRGGQRGGLRAALHNSYKTLPVTKDSMFQSVSYKSSSLINYTIPGVHTGNAPSKLMNILPKTANNVKGNVSNKMDVVNFLRSLEVTSTTNTVSAANIVIPNTFTVNNLPCNGSSLTGTNVSALPFSSFILSNNIVTNTQQDTVFLGGSAPLINPLPSTNTLQAPSLVPGFQTINVSQPLANFPNLNIAPNQNTALGIQQNIAQVFNSGTHSGAIFTGNMNQTVSSVVASTVSSSQQMSYKVPVLIGNQIVIMDMPAQYPTSVSLANTPATVSLPSFGQSLGLFTSAVTPAVDTQQATAACIVSTALPCNSLSANSVHTQPDVAGTSLTMIPQLQSHPGTANTIGAQEVHNSTKTLRSPPPLILAGSTVSQHQSQDGTKLLSAGNNPSASQKTTSTAEVSAKSKLQIVQHVESKSNVGSADVNLFSQLQPKNENNSTDNSKEVHCERNISESQKNTPNSELFVDSAKNLTGETKSNKTNVAPIIVKECSLNNKDMSCMNSKSIYISKDLKSSSNVKTNNHVRTLKMETPDTIERKMFPSGREEKKQSLGTKTPVMFSFPQPVPSEVMTDFARTEKQQRTVKELLKSEESNNVKNMDNERQQKTVRELLQSKKSNSVENMNKSSKSQHIDSKFRLLKPKSKRKLHLRRLQLPLSPEEEKESVDKTLQPPPKPAGNSTTLSPNQTVINGQCRSPADDSDASQSNDDVICKISEVKSIADICPESQPVFLKKKDFSQKCNDLNSARGMVFVGPLTKEQLDLIIQNPSELGKYVNVPSGVVLSSKAIAVPAQPSALTAPAMMKSVTVPKKIAPASAVPSYIPPVYPESQFVKIHPKPTSLPASTATTNTTSSSVASFPQATLPVVSTSFSASPSTMPQTRGNNFSAASDKDIGSKKRIVDEEKSDVKHSPCSSKMYKSEKKFSSYKHKYQLESNTTQDSQNSSIMKLSFNGDLNLLKDALRKTTVELETLDSKTLINAVGNPSPDDDSSCMEMSDSSPDDSKPMRRKRQWRDSEELNIVLTRNKEKEIVENIHKRWVPLEVVGDLAIRGRLLEGEVVESGESENRRIRRSVRISAKPRLDYADLERLPFEDLDHDIESDCELYTTGLRKHSPSPPQLSPVLDQVHRQDMCVDIPHVELELDTAVQSSDTEEQNNDTTVQNSDTTVQNDTATQNSDTAGQNIDTASQNNDATAQNDTAAQNSDIVAQNYDTYAQNDTAAQSSDTATQNNDTAAQDNDTSAQNIDTASQNDTAAQNIDTASQNNDTSSHNNDTASHNNDTAAQNNDIAAQNNDIAAQNNAIAAQNTDGTLHPVLDPPAITDSNDIDSLSQVNSCEDCHYSSESESDMFDSCDKSLNDAGKKKVMRKRHSEITLFLVKHAGKFHSDDEQGEHYCNMCCRYKTNGIFRLSRHLKKHLSGSLRCSQCDFEACHELNLEEHRKTRHSL